MPPRLYIALDLVVNLVLPWAAYTLAQPHLGEVGALLASSVPPILWSGFELIRQRRIDALSMIVISGIVLSVLAMLMGGSARLLLVRESLVSGLIGLVFLASLCFRKPLLYFLAMATLERQEPAAANNLRQNWAQPTMQRVLRLMTLVWGFGLTAEAALRAWLAWHWTPERYLAIAPWIGYAIFGALTAWTFLYRRRLKARTLQKNTDIQLKRIALRL